MFAHRLALDLALTIRHDGDGGVADDLTTPGGMTDWVRERPEPLCDALDAATFTADPDALRAVRELRSAVRSLFARAVRPGPPSPADAHRLLPGEQAVERLNAAAALVPTVPRLEWPEDGAPAARTTGAPAPRGGRRAPVADADRLVAALARDAIGFLAGPERDRLRACHAPRCVRYFVKDHPRQEWCKPSCGNRARVARHQRRHRTAE